MEDNRSFAHTTWNCNDHIVFAPKDRGTMLYGEKRVEIGKMLRERSNDHASRSVPDPIQMLAEIPQKMRVSSFMGFLKGKSSLKIHERHANLKYKHGNRPDWRRGYYVNAAGKNTKRIAEYNKSPLEQDQLQDQMTFREHEDPFKGSKLLQMSDCSKPLQWLPVSAGCTRL